MRLSFVSVGPPYRGGISDLSALIFQQLSREHVVQFVNYTRQYPAFLFPGKTEYKQNNQHTDFPAERIIDSLNPFSWYQAIQRIRRFHPDAVLLRYWNPYFGLLINFISRSLNRSGIQVAVFIDNLLPHESSPLDNWMARRVLAHADHIFTMSRYVAEDVHSFRPELKVTRLIHPLYENYQVLYTKSAARQQLKLTDQQPVMLFFGLIRPYKGLDNLIRALGHLKGQLPGQQTFILGEAYEDAGKYEDLIVAEGVADQVVFKNEFISDADLPLYFAACDVLVLPYRSATQSGIIGIAYQMDRPVIVTNVGGLGEYVDEGETGYLVTPDDPAALAEQIKAFFKGPDRERMVRTVHQHKSKYSIQQFCANIVDQLAHG